MVCLHQALYRDTCLALARRSLYVSEMKEIMNDLDRLTVVDGVFSSEVKVKCFGLFTVTVKNFSDGLEKP